MSIQIHRDTMTGRILIALRAGPIDSEKAQARWGDCRSGFKALIAAGLVVRTPGGSYLITDAGKNVCPTRRKNGQSEIQSGTIQSKTKRQPNGAVAAAVIEILSRAAGPLPAAEVVARAKSISRETVWMCLSRLSSSGTLFRIGQRPPFAYSLPSVVAPVKTWSRGQLKTLVIDLLDEERKPMSVSELAKLTAASVQSLSTTLLRLINMGVVVRARDRGSYRYALKQEAFASATLTTLRKAA